jgi:hypothetical protein
MPDIDQMIRSIRSCHSIVLCLCLLLPACAARGEEGRAFRTEYRDGDLRAQVSRYSIESKPSPVGQAEDFKRELKVRQLQLHEIDWYDVQTEEPLAIPIAADTLRGYEVVALTTTRGRRRESYFAVIALADEYVTFRVTHPPEQTSATRLREFVKSWLTTYLAK